jgi:hypothetical protein
VGTVRQLQRLMHLHTQHIVVVYYTNTMCTQITTNVKFKLLKYLVSSEGNSSSCTAAPQCPSVSLKLAAATALLNILPLRTAVGLPGVLFLGEPLAAVGTAIGPVVRGDAEGDLPRPAALCSPNSALVPAC